MSPRLSLAALAPFLGVDEARSAPLHTSPYWTRTASIGFAGAEESASDEAAVTADQTRRAATRSEAVTIGTGS